MKILNFSLAVGTPENGPSYRAHHFAEEWVRTGHQVTVVGTTFPHQMTRPPEGSGPLIESHVKGVRYCLLRHPPYSKSGLSRGLNVLAGIVQSRLQESRIIRNFRPDLVLASTVYQVDNYAAHRIARKTGAVFLRETRDLWPLTLLQTGKMGAKHPFVRLVQHAEDFGYRHADTVCTTLENSYDHMRTRGLPPERFAYMPQSPEPVPPAPKPLPEPHQRALAGARAAGRLVVAFTGGFNPYADLPTVLRAAKLLRGEAAFFLVGQGPIQGELEHLIASEKITNVQFLPPVPKGALPEVFAASDVGLVGFLNAPIFQFGISPNKLFDYLDHCLPVVLYCNTGKNPVSASGGGFHVPGADPAAIAEALRKLKALSPEQRRALGEKGRDYLRKHHHLPTVAANYLALATRLRASKALTS